MSRGWIVGSLALLVCSFAVAREPTNAEESARSECLVLAWNVSTIAQGRDRGVTREQAVDYYKTVEKKDAVPARAIADVFDFPKLKPMDLARYWDWECQSRSRGIPIALLATVADRFTRCPVLGDPKQRCLDDIRRALKLPEDMPGIPVGSAAYELSKPQLPE